MNSATDPLRHRAIPSQGRIHAWEPWLSADLLLPPCSEANPSQTKFSTATAQDMRTMLEDEFFRDHIQFNQPGAQAPAASPAASSTEETDD
jgi:hypothetical protein